MHLAYRTRRHAVSMILPSDRRTRSTWAGTIVFVLTISIGFARGDENSRQELAAEIAEAYQQSRLADFAQAIPIKWDTLFMFAPYTDRQRIEEKLGFKWPDADRAAIQDSDLFWLFVFVKD